MTARIRGCEGLNRVIEFAEELGFVPGLTRGGHIRFTKTGKQTVFCSRTPGCRRATKNAISDLKKAEAGSLSPALH